MSGRNWRVVLLCAMGVLGCAAGGCNSKAPFQLYAWDGNAEGKMARFPKIWFEKKIKAESVTHTTLGDKGAIVVADDAGGYVVLWDSDPRLQ